MENWLWLLILIFFLFRFLAQAGKRRGTVARRGEPASRMEPEPENQGISELQKFLEQLAGKPPDGRIAPPPPLVRPVEKKPLPAPQVIVRKQDIPAKPPALKLFAPEPVEDEIGEEALTFSNNPIIQGIILSEILRPPKSERRGAESPADLS